MRLIAFVVIDEIRPVSWIHEIRRRPAFAVWIKTGKVRVNVPRFVRDVLLVPCPFAGGLRVVINAFPNLTERATHVSMGGRSLPGDLSSQAIPSEHLVQKDPDKVPYVRFEMHIDTPVFSQQITHKNDAFINH